MRAGSQISKRREQTNAGSCLFLNACSIWGVVGPVGSWGLAPGAGRSELGMCGFLGARGDLRGVAMGPRLLQMRLRVFVTSLFVARIFVAFPSTDATNRFAFGTKTGRFCGLEFLGSWPFRTKTGRFVARIFFCKLVLWWGPGFGGRNCGHHFVWRGEACSYPVKTVWPEFC